MIVVPISATSREVGETMNEVGSEPPRARTSHDRGSADHTHGRTARMKLSGLQRAGGPACSHVDFSVLGAPGANWTSS